MNNLIEKIKKKKELSDIPDNLIKSTLSSYLKKNNLNIPKEKKQIKVLVKEIRAELRRYTGQYQSKSPGKRVSLLNQNKIIELLKTHSSTKERLDFYNELKELIYSLNPKSILDLGCGLNPLVLAKQKINYYAYDIKKSELDLIKEYFKVKKIQGRIFHKDITKISNFPKTDICLIFKVLDILENKNQSILLFQRIKSKIILVSFSTKTLSGKPMKQKRRFWFENFLENSGYNFKIKRFTNEIFYLVENKLSCKSS